MSITAISRRLFAKGMAASGLMLGGAVSADEWTRWGGPNQNLHSGASGFNKDWRSTPPEMQWNSKIGTGFSGITVAGGRLYSMGRSGQQNDAVYCLDQTTGKTIWKHEYVAELEPRLFEGGPGSTPTISGDVVFTLSRQGQLHALDASSGKVRWSHKALEITGGEQPYWGTTSSGLVVGEVVVFDIGCLVAFRVKDGGLAWKTKLHRSGYGTPVVCQLGTVKSICMLTNDGLLAVDPENGKVIAFAEWETPNVTSSTTPIVFDNHVFVSTGYKRGCALFKFRNSSFEKVYESKDLANHMSNSVLHKGHIYGINGNSHSARNCTLTCINANSGERRWRERGMGCGSLLLADGYLIVLSDKGGLSLVSASPDGFSSHGTVQVLSGKCWTVPTAVDNSVYCRNADGDITCWRLPL